MSEDLAPYFGVWALAPDRSAYGDTPAPLSGVYTLLPEGDALWFHVRWRAAEGGVQQLEFRGRLDVPMAVDPETPDVKLVTRLDDGGLVTEVRHGEQVLQSATRRIVDDTMVVRQVVVGGPSATETEAVYLRANVKQVMIYRRDLKMRKGKIAAQCAHASMAVFFQRDEGALSRLEVPLDGPMAVWSKGRFAKVVLSVETEQDLLQIAEHAQARGIPHAVITDSGKTEFKGQPTRTTVALGPAADVEIDEITGPSGLVATKLA